MVNPIILIKVVKNFNLKAINLLILTIKHREVFHFVFWISFSCFSSFCLFQTSFWVSHQLLIIPVDLNLLHCHLNLQQFHLIVLTIQHRQLLKLRQLRQLLLLLLLFWISFSCFSSFCLFQTSFWVSHQLLIIPLYLYLLHCRLNLQQFHLIIPIIKLLQFLYFLLLSLFFLFSYFSFFSFFFIFIYFHSLLILLLFIPTINPLILPSYLTNYYYFLYLLYLFSFPFFFILLSSLFLFDINYISSFFFLRILLIFQYLLHHFILHFLLLLLFLTTIHACDISSLLSFSLIHPYFNDHLALILMFLILNFYQLILQLYLLILKELFSLLTAFFFLHSTLDASFSCKGCLDLVFGQPPLSSHTMVQERVR